MKTRADASGRSSEPFSKIRRPETPERRARIDAIKSAMDEGDRLFAVRKGRGITQAVLAQRLGISQGNVSELERRDDVYLSTLRGYVEALGGRLEVAAVFDDGAVPLAIRSTDE